MERLQRGAVVDRSAGLITRARRIHGVHVLVRGVRYGVHVGVRHGMWGVGHGVHVRSAVQSLPACANVYGELALPPQRSPAVWSAFVATHLSRWCRVLSLMRVWLIEGAWSPPRPRCRKSTTPDAALALSPTRRLRVPASRVPSSRIRSSHKPRAVIADETVTDAGSLAP